MKQSDQIQRFTFENRAIRGQLVNLSKSYEAIVQPHNYPPILQQTLGKALCIVSLLSSNLKFDGQLSLQCQSEGPVSMLLAKCDHDQQLRGLIKYNTLTGEESFTDLFNNGQLAITVDQIDQHSRYQGLVPMEGENLAEFINLYFAQSEQLATKLWLFADQHHAAGLLLQALGDDQKTAEEKAEDWNYVCHMAETIKPNEIMSLDNINLLHKLFHEDDINLYEPSPMYYRCSCSREKISNTILGLGETEANSIIKEQGKIEATCEFCLSQYSFDAVDVAEIFKGTITNPDQTH